MSRTPSPFTREVWMHVKDNARLRRRRRDKGFSQKQLAGLVDCTQQYISLLESGNDTDCSEKIAERLCRWLDVDLEDFFEERSIVRMPAVATPSRDGSAA
jgi:transcriptional regulator with XRE-family HTH domain